MNKKNSYKFFGILYLLFTSYLTYLLNDNFFFQFILVLIICIFTDIGGYIFGRTFKGPELTKISPKKTYAGLIGSYISSIVAALIYIKYINLGGASYLEINVLLSGKDVENIKLFFLIIIAMSDDSLDKDGRESVLSKVGLYEEVENLNQIGGGVTINQVNYVIEPVIFTGRLVGLNFYSTRSS